MWLHLQRPRSKTPSHLDSNTESPLAAFSEMTRAACDLAQQLRLQEESLAAATG